MNLNTLHSDMVVNISQFLNYQGMRNLLFISQSMEELKSHKQILKRKFILYKKLVYSEIFHIINGMVFKNIILNCHIIEGYIQEIRKIPKTSSDIIKKIDEVTKILQNLDQINHSIWYYRPVNVYRYYKSTRDEDHLIKDRLDNLQYLKTKLLNMS
tara:strand:- start:504 stop:971 length:468 start_codon:yes stop_codon:yes gene_type:complete